MRWLPVWGLRLQGIPETESSIADWTLGSSNSAVWNAGARSVHVGLFAEVFRAMARRLPARMRGATHQMVHHCAGEVNGLWWAARAAFGERVELLGVSEIHACTLRRLCEAHAPGWSSEDARRLAEAMGDAPPHFLAMGWPCPAYSAAVHAEGGRGGRAEGERAADRWLNTQLVCDVLRISCEGRALEQMPWAVVLENVPWLARSQANTGHTSKS